ncbi:MAG TPA: hypothetical protein VIG97_14455 [Luteimonas sp.]
MSTRSDWPQGVLNRERTLQILREHNAWRRGAEGPQTDPRMLGLALDAAIEALASAPQPPSGGEVVMYADGALDDAIPAALMESLKQSSEGNCPAMVAKYSVPLYTAPPSAPVGVDGFDAWWKSHSIDPEFPETMDDRTFAKAAWDAALAQQPAAEFHNDGNSEADFIAHHADACTACGGSGHKDDQQPAAVDGAMVRRIEGLARRWDESANNDKHDDRRATKRKCAADLRALTAALATQPGGAE